MILDQFDIALESVVAIYPYGSRVYGSHTEESDHDWIIVYKSSLLPSGAFRDNAISSEDRSHQAVCYSRSGFRNAIDTYDIVALECAFLPEDVVLLQKMSFPIRKWVPKEMASSVIAKASASWHMAMKGSDDDERTRKNVYHALRILEFGAQMAMFGRINEFSSAIGIKNSVMNDEAFHASNYIGTFNNALYHLRTLVKT